MAEHPTATVEFPEDWTAEQVARWRAEFDKKERAAGHLRASVAELLPVLLPCPGRPACPAEWFDSPGHQHFMRAGCRVRVRRLLAACWEVLCPCCRERPVVAQVAMWERAMRRAGEHVREAHPPPNDAILASEGQAAAACRALYNQWTWGWVRHGERPDPQRLHHELYCAVLGELVQDG